MNLTKIAIDIAAKCKPILVKIIPIQLLRNVKDGLIEKNTNNLKNQKIKGFDPEKFKDGINLIGNIKADNGLGQSTRLIADILTNSGVQFSVCNYYQLPGGSMTDSTYEYKISEDLPFNINLIHVNPSEFTVAYMQLGKKIWDGRYNIAFWLWELEEFPDEWVGCIDLVDEIWTPAEFVSESIRKKTDKPVRTIPYPVKAPTDERYDRKHFNLPKDKFLFFMMYNSGSIMERKNPIGTLEAFKKAFDKDNSNVGLVIKINEMEDSSEIARIKDFFDGYTSIYFITNNMSKVEVNSLVKAVDVLVSLHRAEGFGLGMAEAMLVGTPTIATNWSANTEFMNHDVACMVDYELIEIKEDYGLFKKGYRWADADINQAAEYMKKLYQDTDFAVNMADEAKTFIEAKLSMESSVKLVKDRVEQIYLEKRKLK